MRPYSCNFNLYICIVIELSIYSFHSIKKIVEEQQEKFRTRYFTLTQAEAIAKATVCTIRTSLKKQGRPAPKIQEKKNKKIETRKMQKKNRRIR